MNENTNYSGMIDEHGHLPYPQRAEILNSISRNQRHSLAYRVAKHVEPIWVKGFPTKNEPFELLEKIQQSSPINNQGISQSEFFNPISHLQNSLDQLWGGGEEYYHSIFAGYAACSACYVLCDDEVLHHELQEKDPERQYGPSFYASCAYSGGPYWKKFPSSPEKRREFWIWYLEEVGNVRVER